MFAASAQGSLAGAPEREVTSMAIPNIGPEHADSGDPDAVETPRRGNPAPVLRDEPVTDDMAAASARASTVTHRFGGVRYALTRPDVTAAHQEPPAEEGDSDARQ
jgi:hypothetical protein